MMLFENPRDEDNLCDALKAFVEEWGPERVIVAVPKTWEEYSLFKLGKVRLEYSTENCVLIRVECGIGEVIYKANIVS